MANGGVEINNSRACASKNLQSHRVFPTRRISAGFVPMARSNAAVYLGYDDEIVAEKHKGIVNFATNKIGGKPDVPNNLNLQNPVCPLCQLPRPLVLQLYAPLENVYHRTLYIFACINPNCWNQSDSWACLRVQTIEDAVQPVVTETVKSIGVTDWCQGADNWDDDANANSNEENGNVIGNVVERISDEDDESFDDSVRLDLENLKVDDRNANKDAQGGAVGRLHSPAATAEIEGDESEVISIDTPTIPQHDIIALLQEVAPLPQELCHKAKVDVNRSSIIQFVPYFVNVWEESKNASISDHHVRELLQEYQQNSEECFTSPMESEECGAVGDNATLEKYEKSMPAHGDKMFHHFLSRIQMNPGQMLRYCRDSSPLLLYPMQDMPMKCQHCQEDMTFELQVLPTLIPKLQLTSDPRHVTRLEFGNVLIFTCKRSCWPTDVDFRRETVVVQTEMY